MKAIRLGIVACLVFFLMGCMHQKDTNWKTELLAGMEVEINESDDHFAKKEKMESLVPVFELLNGGKMVKVTLEGLYLVPKDDINAPSFLPARIRVVSLFKERNGYKTKFLSEKEVINGAVVITIPNPARKFGEPFVDGWWGMGLSEDGEPGYVMIDPDDDFTVYKTVTFGGYKTISGDKADRNTLLICPVFYKDKIRPLKEVLMERNIDMNDFYHGGTGWGYCPKLADN